MGMFDKDKEIGIIVTTLYDLGEQFILWDAKIKREDYPTDLGLAVQSELVTSKLEDPQSKFTCTTLGSAIASKVREAESTDFPAVVQLRQVPGKMDSQALIIQFLKPYTANA